MKISIFYLTTLLTFTHPALLFAGIDTGFVAKPLPPVRCEPDFNRKKESWLRDHRKYVKDGLLFALFTSLNSGRDLTTDQKKVIENLTPVNLTEELPPQLLTSKKGISTEYTAHMMSKYISKAPNLKQKAPNLKQIIYGRSSLQACGLTATRLNPR